MRVTIALTAKRPRGLGSRGSRAGVICEISCLTRLYSAKMRCQHTQSSRLVFALPAAYRFSWNSTLGGQVSGRSRSLKSDAVSASADSSHAVSSHRRKRKKRSKLTAGILITIIPIVVTAIVADLNNWLTNPASPPSPKIELDYAKYTPPRYAETPYKIDTELRNTGNQLAVITALRIQVQQALKLPICFTQGNLPISGNVTANIGADTKPGKVITVPVHQQVGPDGADRFAVNIRGPQSEDETVYMYRVRLTLLYDTGITPAVQVGELLMAFPFTPSNQYFWTRADVDNNGSRMSYMGPEVPKIRSCMISNSRKLQRFLALDGERPGLGAINTTISTKP